MEDMTEIVFCIDKNCTVHLILFLHLHDVHKTHIFDQSSPGEEEVLLKTVAKLP